VTGIDAGTLTGAVVAVGCTLVGAYVDTPWKSGTGTWGVDFAGNGGWGTLAVLIALAALAVGLTGLGTARARAVAPQGTAQRALILACLGAVALAIFYTGAPAILAGGASGLALDARRRLDRLPASAAVALVLAGLTAVVALYLAFTG
jgi:hypothetical protein